ncbi:hypothetical protein MAR_019555, partial [Mya arenaria]
MESLLTLPSISQPIRCFYCFGPAQNSSCADPVDPREDKGKALEVIKSTIYAQNLLPSSEAFQDNDERWCMPIRRLWKRKFVYV